MGEFLFAYRYFPHLFPHKGLAFGQSPMRRSDAESEPSRDPNRRGHQPGQQRRARPVQKQGRPGSHSDIITFDSIPSLCTQWTFVYSI